MDIQSVIVSFQELENTKNNIASAITEKGVTSEGKFSKFPDEIKRISSGTNEQSIIQSILYKTKQIDWEDTATTLPEGFGQGITFNNVSLPNVVSVDSRKILQLSTVNNFSAPNMVSCIDILNMATVGSLNLPKLKSCGNLVFNGTIKTIYLPELTDANSQIGGGNTQTIVLPKIVNLYDFALQAVQVSTRIYLGKDLKKFPVLPSSFNSNAPELVVVLDTPQVIPISQFTSATIDNYVSRRGNLIISVLDSAYDSFKNSHDWDRYSTYIKKRSETPADKLEFLQQYGLR